jgi:hypothetical protein
VRIDETTKIFMLKNKAYKPKAYRETRLILVKNLAGARK